MELSLCLERGDEVETLTHPVDSRNPPLLAPSAEKKKWLPPRGMAKQPATHPPSPVPGLATGWSGRWREKKLNFRELPERAMGPTERWRRLAKLANNLIWTSDHPASPSLF